MTSNTRVVDSVDFVIWLADLEATGNIPDPPGLDLLKNTGCLACHSQDGSRLVGPSFKGVFGAEKTVITDGEERTIIADEEYLKLSITDPEADIVKGLCKGTDAIYTEVF